MAYDVEAGRWDWFARHQNRMSMGGANGKAAKIGTLAQYQSWLVAGPPPDAVVGSQQLPAAVPVAVDWILVEEDGQDSWAAVDPSAGLGPSVYWGTTADTPVGQALAGATASYLGGVYIEWSVAGQRYWQMCDATPRGTLVIGVADWVRVSYMGCEQTFGEAGPDCFVWFDETAARCRATLRPAEMGERGNARVSHGMVAMAAVSNSSVVALWLGQRAQRYTFNICTSVVAASSISGVSVFNLLGMRLATYAWASNNNPGLGMQGRPPNEQIDVRLPAGAWSVQGRCNQASTMAWHSTLEGGA